MGEFSPLSPLMSLTLLQKFTPHFKILDPPLHRCLFRVNFFLHFILQVMQGQLKQSRVIMALQVNQMQIKTIARLYAIMKRERNLEPYYDNDATRTFTSSWRWTGAELHRWPTGHWKCVFDKLNAVFCKIDYMCVFRVPLAASETSPCKLKANRRRGLVWECPSHWT